MVAGPFVTPAAGAGVGLDGCRLRALRQLVLFLLCRRGRLFCTWRVNSARQGSAAPGEGVRWRRTGARGSTRSSTAGRWLSSRVRLPGTTGSAFWDALATSKTTSKMVCAYICFNYNIRRVEVHLLKY